MEIRLMGMEIRNFKGIRELVLDLDGKDAVICGANATGKTSVYDAFLWLLFDKDSSQSSKFSVKPVKNGEEQHNLTTSVSVCLRIDGVCHTLTRTLSENWVKPRGRAEAVFQGNVSGYEIDDVPRRAGEFAAFCTKLVDESTFRLITNPAAFNALKWQDRRKHLLRLSNAPKEINSSKYAPIIEQVRRVGAEDLKKQFSGQRRKYNTELEQIPARMDEVMAMMPSVISAEQIANAERGLEDTEHRMDDLRRRMRDVSGTRESMQREADELKQRIEDTQRRSRAAVERHQLEQEREKARQLKRIEEAQRNLEDCRKNEENSRHHAENMEKECIYLRTEWKEVQAEQFPEIDTLCPTCGQQLPTDAAQELRRSAQAEWYARKKKRLDSIRADGKRVAAVRDQLLAAADQWHSRAEECLGELEEAQSASETVLAAPEIETVDKRLHERLSYLQKQLQMPQDGAPEQLREQLNSLTAQCSRYRAILSDRDRLRQCEKRRDELTVRQQELGRQIMEIDRNIMLLEEYVQEMCRSVEESVSARFPTVRWRLYEKQINGGLADACTCLVGGVPYADANNAAKINAGLEIINVLSEHIGVQVPIFVDNAEAVNRVAATRGQQIRLIVTDDPQLIVRKGV